MKKPTTKQKLEKKVKEWRRRFKCNVQYIGGDKEPVVLVFDKAHSAKEVEEISDWVRKNT